jgi:hypothetical protein
VFPFFLLVLLLHSPFVSWDGKATAFLAALGGTKDLIRASITRLGFYDGFVQRVSSEWSKAFPDVNKGLSKMSLPTSFIARRRP